MLPTKGKRSDSLTSIITKRITFITTLLLIIIAQACLVSQYAATSTNVDRTLRLAQQLQQPQKKWEEVYAQQPHAKQLKQPPAQLGPMRERVARGTMLPNFLSDPVEKVWEELLLEAQKMLERGQAAPGVVMEVGMHRPHQCLQAATVGLHAHCFEPSPSSFSTIQKMVGRNKAANEVKERVHLYNEAAGATTGDLVPFVSDGSTGDHVGEQNAWTMEQHKDPGATVVNVPTRRLDDIIKKTGDVYLLKIDTQGYEPAIFEGLSGTLQSHAAKFILFEYWPKGIDLLQHKLWECSSVAMLESLLAQGYTLYPLSMQGHPKAGKEWKAFVRNHSQPLSSVKEHCEWFYDLERRFSPAEYKMGYWTDIFAVAPNATTILSQQEQQNGQSQGMTTIGAKLLEAAAATERIVTELTRTE